MTDAQSTISFADKMRAAKALKASLKTNAGSEPKPVKSAKINTRQVALGKQSTKPVTDTKAAEKKVAKVSAARAKANGKAEARRAIAARANHSPRKLRPELAPAKKVSKAEAQKAADAFMKAAVKRANKPVAQPTVEGPHGPPTIARSYKREFRGNGATLRGKMLQVTVTFTAAQFDVLKERADLYGASLSETIRKCVISGPLSVPLT